MQHYFKIFSYCALLILASNSSAQNIPGMLGFNLGAKFEAEECPKSGPGVIYPPVCATYLSASSWGNGPMADRYQIIMDLEKLPTWAAGQFTAAVVNGNIVELKLNTRGGTVQVDAYDAAVKRLGRPNKNETKTWVHKQFGAIKSISAIWKNQNWQATFEGILISPDMGYLIMSIPEEKTNKSSPPL